MQQSVSVIWMESYVLSSPKFAYISFLSKLIFRFLLGTQKQKRRCLFQFLLIIATIISKKKKTTSSFQLCFWHNLQQCNWVFYTEKNRYWNLEGIVLCSVVPPIPQPPFTILETKERKSQFPLHRNIKHQQSNLTLPSLKQITVIKTILSFVGVTGKWRQRGNRYSFC